MVAVQELISKVLTRGGCLVSSADLLPGELVAAEREGTAAKLACGAWLVWVPDERVGAVLGRVPVEPGAEEGGMRGPARPPTPRACLGQGLEGSGGGLFGDRHRGRSQSPKKPPPTVPGGDDDVERGVV